MNFPSRLQSSFRAAGIHWLSSAGVVMLAALLVFGLWFPYPYRHLSGGWDLFLLVTSVDLICGPLLTLVVFNPAKSRAELWRDMGLVVLIQMAALLYGMSTVWQARPLFLAMEIDRFRVISAVDLQGASLTELPTGLQPGWMTKPIRVAIREPKDNIERQKVLFESIQGGRDYADRPEFYLPYEGEAALKSLKRAKPLSVFLEKRPDQKAAAFQLATKKGVELSQWLYLPIRARQEWVAILDKNGQIQGYLEGDGF